MTHVKTVNGIKIKSNRVVIRAVGNHVEFADGSWCNTGSGTICALPGTTITMIEEFKDDRRKRSVTASHGPIAVHRISGSITVDNDSHRHHTQSGSFTVVERRKRRRGQTR